MLTVFKWQLTVVLPVQQCQPQSDNHCIYKGESSECRASGHRCRGQNSQPGKQGEQFSDDIFRVIFKDLTNVSKSLDTEQLFSQAEKSNREE